MTAKDIKVKQHYKSIVGNEIEVLSINKQYNIVMCKHVNNKFTWIDAKGNKKEGVKKNFTTSLDRFTKDFRHGN